MIMTTTKRQGFSLLEIMVTFAIILILSLVAYPVLLPYLAESKVADAIQAMQQVQTMIDNNIANLGSVTNSGAGLTTPTTVSKYVASYSVSNDGVISFTTTTDAGGVSINLSPVYNSTAEQVSWTCAVTNSSMNSSVPVECRI